MSARAVIFFIFWFFSLCSIVAGVLLCLKKERRKNLKTTVITGTVGVGFAVFFLRFSALLPIEETFLKQVYAVLKTLGSSLIHTLQTFSLDEEYEKFFEKPLFVPAAESLSEPISVCFTVYSVILNVIAPVMTLAIVAALLEEVIARLKAGFRPFRKKYVFSELNDCTVTMAEDLRSRDKRCFLLFADSRMKEDDDLSSELRERARLIGASCIKEDVTTMRLRHSPLASITYVLADLNESDNLRVAAWIARGSKKIDRFRYADVLVYCSGEDAETTLQAIIDHRSNKNIRFYPVNTSLVTLYDLLLKHPFCKRLDRKKEQKTCSILIVGCGYIGFECLKALSWCGQLPDTKLKLTVISLDADKREKNFRASCPELFSTGLYDITFKACDTSSNEFEEYLIENTADVCYAVVALGDERQNIGVANTLRRIYDRIHLTGGTAPQICYMVPDDNVFEAVSIHTKEIAENECEMVPFGNNRDSFRAENVCNSFLDHAALYVHLTYYWLPILIDEDSIKAYRRLYLRGGSPCRTSGKDKNAVSARYDHELFSQCFPRHPLFFRFLCGIPALLRFRPAFPEEDQEKLKNREKAVNKFFDSIYNQNSSKASAIHMCYKLAVLSFAEKEDDLTEDVCRRYGTFIADPANSIAVSKLEHLRWDAYMRSIGYVRPNEETYRSYAFKNGNEHWEKRLKYHPCLVDWTAKGLVLKKEDYALYEKKDPSFMNGRFINELDELDRMSLTVWLDKKNAEGKDEFIDFKRVDEDIIKKTADILRAARDKKGMF